MISVLCLEAYFVTHLLPKPKSKRPQSEKFVKGENNKLKIISRPALTMSIEDKFTAAIKVIQNLPTDGPYQPSNSTKLKFYSLYKQATDGPCNISKPAFWDIIGRAKWDAWSKLGKITKAAAMHEYIEELKKVIMENSNQSSIKIVETMSFNGDVQDFLDSIGPFYEFINLHQGELGHVKESLDRFASSASSSQTNSPGNSCEGSPEKSPSQHSPPSIEYSEEPDETIVVRATTEVDVHTIPESQKKVKLDVNSNGGYLKARGESSAFFPPPTPTHRAREVKPSNGHPRFPSSDNDEEIIEIYAQEGPSSSKREKQPTPTSGTDSEKYYSGDSEPEGDLDNDDGLMRPDGLKSTLVSAAVLGGARKVKEKVVNSMVDHQLRKNKERGGSPEVALVLNATIDRLNRDVEHITARLRILEAAYAANVENGVQTRTKSVPLRTYFGGLSAKAMALIFAWPFVAHFIVKLIFWWIRRKRRTPLAITGP